MVTNVFPKFSETFIMNQVLDLLDHGWDVQIVCGSSDPAQWKYFPDAAQRPGLRERVHVTRDMEPTLLALRPDLIHFQFGALAVGRIHLRDVLGSRVIVSFRGYDLNDFRPGDRTCYQETWDRADVLHFVSEDLWRRAQARGCPPEKAHVVIHDAVDAAYFDPGDRVHRETVGRPERPFRILSVGRLHWKKGYEFGLQAVQQLVRDGIECEYRIIGEGDYRPAVEYTIHDLGLESVVQVIGAHQRAEVRESLRWADVLFHPAISEGFCVSVLEGQSMGVPVVCSDAGGLPENVREGETGFLFPRRHPHAAASRLRLLAGSPGLRQHMGAAGRRRVHEHFLFGLQTQRFDRLYQELAGASSPAGAPADPAAPDPAPGSEALAGLTARVARLQTELGAVRRRMQRWEIVPEVQRGARLSLPAGARVLVVSRGDDALLELDGRRAEHFPQAEGGTYAGHHPADSAEAIAHLEALRAQGAQFLLFPSTAFWWLDHYEGLRLHLEERYRLLIRLPALAVFDVRKPSRRGSKRVPRPVPLASRGAA